VQDLIGFVTPIFHFIFILFGASTADSIPVILSSCLFLTGFLRKTNSDSSYVKPRKLSNPVNKEDIRAHISELTSQAKLGPETNQRPIPYPHENVVFHVAQLQAENLRKQRKKKSSTQSFEVVSTLRQAAEKTGIERDEILTTREIEAEYNINKKLVHEYTKRGRQGRPHLTPLPVRLKGSGLGGGQLLFRREDIERLVANPPSSYKGGRPRK
jgi:hypothetical protein